MKNTLDLRNAKAVYEAGEVETEKKFQRYTTIAMVAMFALLLLGIWLIY